MNASQLRSKVPLANAQNDVERETTTDSQSGSLRRKLVLGTAILGIGMYVRRRRSRTGELKPDTIADEAGTATESTPEEPTEMEPGAKQPSKRGGGIGRRLKLLVVSTVMFALARRVIRRFK